VPNPSGSSHLPKEAIVVTATEHKQLHLTIIVDGKPKHVNARADTLVLDVIGEALGPQRAGDADQYELVPAGGSALDPAVTLAQAGVADRSELSLNKKDGGGAAR
jgi:hypothetical protein